MFLAGWWWIIMFACAKAEQSCSRSAYQREFHKQWPSAQRQQKLELAVPQSQGDSDASFMLNLQLSKEYKPSWFSFDGADARTGAWTASVINSDELKQGQSLGGNTWTLESISAYKTSASSIFVRFDYQEENTERKVMSVAVPVKVAKTGSSNLVAWMHAVMPHTDLMMRASLAGPAKGKCEFATPGAEDMRKVDELTECEMACLSSNGVGQRCAGFSFLPIATALSPTGPYNCMLHMGSDPIGSTHNSSWNCYMVEKSQYSMPPGTVDSIETFFRPSLDLRGGMAATRSIIFPTDNDTCIGELVFVEVHAEEDDVRRMASMKVDAANGVFEHSTASGATTKMDAANGIFEHSTASGASTKIDSDNGIFEHSTASGASTKVDVRSGVLEHSGRYGSAKVDLANGEAEASGDIGQTSWSGAVSASGANATVDSSGEASWGASAGSGNVKATLDAKTEHHVHGNMAFSFVRTARRGQASQFTVSQEEWDALLDLLEETSVVADAPSSVQYLDHVCVDTFEEGNCLEDLPRFRLAVAVKFAFALTGSVACVGTCCSRKQKKKEQLVLWKDKDKNAEKNGFRQCKYVPLPKFIATRLPESLLVQMKSKVYVLHENEQMGTSKTPTFSHTVAEFKNEYGQEMPIELEPTEELVEIELDREPLSWIPCLSKESCLVKGFTFPSSKFWHSFEVKLPDFLMKPTQYQLLRRDSSGTVTGKFTSTAPLHPTEKNCRTSEQLSRERAKIGEAPIEWVNMSTGMPYSPTTLIGTGTKIT